MECLQIVSMVISEFIPQGIMQGMVVVLFVSTIGSVCLIQFGIASIILAIADRLKPRTDSSPVKSVNLSAWWHKIKCDKKAQGNVS